MAFGTRMWAFQPLRTPFNAIFACAATQAEAGALAALLHPATALLFVPLVPVAYVIFGVLMCAAMCAIKWTALGRAKPGTHRCGLSPE